MNFTQKQNVEAEEELIDKEGSSECVGPGTEKAGKADGCSGCSNQPSCSGDEEALKERRKDHEMRLQRIQEQLKFIDHKIFIFSGKGGVGKSTVSAQLSLSLGILLSQQQYIQQFQAQKKYKTGLCDIDLCGPSIPRMVGVQGKQVPIREDGQGWDLVKVNDNLGILSLEFMLKERDEAVIWRGPIKAGVITQFLGDCFWGSLDYLIIDTLILSTSRNI